MPGFLTSLRSRIVISIVAIEVVILSALVWSNTLHVLDTQKERLDDTSQVIAHQFTEAAGRLLIENDIATLEEHARTALGHEEVLYVIVKDLEFNTLVNFGVLPDEGGKLPENSILEISESVTYSGKPRGKLRMGFSSDPLARISREVRNRNIIVALIGIALSIIFALFIGHLLSSDLETLTDAVRRFARGEKDVSVKIQSKDEIGELSSAINKMIVERKEAEETIWHQANYDDLTGLPNRNVFFDRLQMAQLSAERDSKMVAIHFIDLDYFKDVNDTEGHSVGDVLLQEVALRLRGAVRRTDTVARLGGDEFGIVQTSINHISAAEALAEKILTKMQEPYNLGHKKVFIGASIGITVYPMDDEAPDELLRNADIAMYAAKDSGRNTFEFFARDMSEDIKSRNVLEQELHEALDKQEFFLLYQPKFSGQGKDITGVEALLRWNHPLRGLISPDDFIPLAERSGMIAQIGSWVLKEACIQAKAWQDKGLPLFNMAVNLSAVQLAQEDLAAMIKQVLQETGLNPHFLELEITESTMMHDPANTVDILDELDALGVKISLDDFGTGYSSLAYLKRFPLSRIKIDKSFTRDILTNPDDAAIVTAIITLARTLNMAVTAEGVETEDQFEYLLNSDCDEYQGYLLGMPMAAADLVDMLKQRNVS